MSAIKAGTWTRRQFGLIAAASAAGFGLTPLARGASAVRTEQLAFAGTVTDGDAGAIHALRVADGRATTVSVTSCVAPGRLLLHPSLPVLYVLHDVALWEHLPRGAVSAYRFDAATGNLTLLDTQPLSLAATHPRDGAVFLNATALFVMTGAGIYNVLPLTNDGSLHPVSAIRKVVGQTGVLVRVSHDTETLVVPTRETTPAFRLIQDGDGAQIQEVAREGVRLQRRDSIEERVECSLLHCKLAAAHPGLRSMVLYKA